MLKVFAHLHEQFPIGHFPYLRRARRSIGINHERSQTFRRGNFSKRLLRRLVALLIVLNLRLWPGVLPDALSGLLPVRAQNGVVAAGGPIGYLPFVVKALLWFVPPRPQREETLADRILQVARLNVSPLKLVAYENQVMDFTALPT